MDNINWSEIYEDGKCPDCGEHIPGYTQDGESCLNCEHTFIAFPQSDE